MNEGRDSSGMTLVEVLIALAILALVMMAMLPSFLSYFDANTRNEQRTGAVEAAQHVVETLRRDDPATLPTSGSSSIQVVTVGSRDYEVVTHYCRNASFCTSASRHLVIEVRLGGSEIYSVESVFTQLQ